MKKEDFNFDIVKVEHIFYNNLSEKDKRLFVGLESMKIGYNGVSVVSVRYKINKHTVRKGQRELLSGDVVGEGRIRKKGGGRKKS